jgi:pimeloyl-ACP methyl ester carboxylesterase
MRPMLTATLTVLGIALAAIALLGLFLYITQERMLFFPRQNDPQLRAHWRWQRVEIPSGEHVLEGWWADAAAPESELTIVYFGGNAEDVLYTARNAERIGAKRMLVVNYRGYGGTKGKPSQSALFGDALAIYDYLIGPGGAAADDIVVMGRSLGSGVATMLAATRRVRAAVLITPFDSIKAVAARHYPAILVEWLLRHPFPSTEFAPKTAVPALFMIAAHDEVIAPSHAEALARAWGGAKDVHTFPDARHNDIDQHPDYYRVLNAFLHSIAMHGRPASTP